MKLTTRCRYGTRAITEISINFGIRPTKKREIALNQNIPDSYLENILADLRKSRLIETIRGVNGGYQLKRPPGEITVLDVVTALDGGLEPVACLKEDENCSRKGICSARDIWRELQEAQEAVLSRYTIADLTSKNYK